MADVRTMGCFPTLIHDFTLDLDNDKMLDYVYEMNIRSPSPLTPIPTSSDVKSGFSTDQQDLHKLLIFKPLVDELTKIHEFILRNLEYEYDKVEITNMWANHLYGGDSHAPHTHSNNFLSGVYYLLAGKNEETNQETAPIQFFDPRPQANVLRPRTSKPNQNNASMLSFNSENGIGLIFPSWLQHWVPPTPLERISVSWNVLVRGHYGEPKTLQNAYI